MPHVVSNAEEVRAIIEASDKVALVLQAHYHSGDDVVQNGIRYYTQPALFKKGVYSVLTIDENGISIEQETV